MIDLKFSYNWNHKLDCHAFTTIRIYNPDKHYVGQSVRLLLKDQEMGTGLIHGVNAFYLASLNPFMSYIDTGYSVEETASIIRRMYPKVNFSTTRMVMLLIVKDERKEPKQKELFETTINNTPE